VGALLDLALEGGQTTQFSSHAASSVAREREQRINQAIRMLRDVPSRHAAFVAGQPADGHVPVTVVICTSAGLATGDLEIPEGRWDPWLFLRFLQEQDERIAS
jgi:hypothetical protein